MCNHFQNWAVKNASTYKLAPSAYTDRYAYLSTKDETVGSVQGVRAVIDNQVSPLPSPFVLLIVFSL
jgi:hypothetical protein